MRLAVISDVHGNLAALEAVLADIAIRAPDAIVNLGDCVTSPLWPRETWELLDATAMPTVRGNHDRRIAEPAHDDSPSILFTRESLTAEQRAALGALPMNLTLSDDVFAVHGNLTSDSEYLLEEQVDGRLALVTAAVLGERLGSTDAGLILCGHSHHQHATYAPGNRLVLNPGSVGCPRHVDNVDPFRAEASSPHARYVVATRRSAGWSVELIVLDYDWDVVAEQARRNGRDDWAQAFLGDSR